MIVMLYSHIVGRTPFIFSLNTHRNPPWNARKSTFAIHARGKGSMSTSQPAIQPSSQLALFKKRRRRQTYYRDDDVHFVDGFFECRWWWWRLLIFSYLASPHTTTPGSFHQTQYCSGGLGHARCCHRDCKTEWQSFSQYATVEFLYLAWLSGDVQIYDYYKVHGHSTNGDCVSNTEAMIPIISRN